MRSWVSREIPGPWSCTSISEYAGGSQTVDNFHTVIGSFVGRDPNFDWLSLRILGRIGKKIDHDCGQSRNLVQGTVLSTNKSANKGL
jgi:hypothetical protein